MVKQIKLTGILLSILVAFTFSANATGKAGECDGTQKRVQKQEQKQLQMNKQKGAGNMNRKGKGKHKGNKLSKEEKLKRFDTDKDGKLSKEERKAMRKAMKAEAPKKDDVKKVQTDGN